MVNLNKGGKLYQPSVRLFMQKLLVIKLFRKLLKISEKLSTEIFILYD